MKAGGSKVFQWPLLAYRIKPTLSPQAQGIPHSWLPLRSIGYPSLCNAAELNSSGSMRDSGALHYTLLAWNIIFPLPGLQMFWKSFCRRQLGNTEEWYQPTAPASQHHLLCFWQALSCQSPALRRVYPAGPAGFSSNVQTEEQDFSSELVFPQDWTTVPKLCIKAP